MHSIRKENCSFFGEVYDRAGKRMMAKRRRTISFFLLGVSFLIPLSIAYLYITYYSEMDFQLRKHFSEVDEENFLVSVQKNPRVFSDPKLLLVQYIFSTLEFPFLPTYTFIIQDSTHPVLRC
jgi:hypothetical protein